MKTILTPVDFSPATRGVIAASLDLATTTGGRIVLLHSLQNPIVTTDYGLTAELLQETIQVNEGAARRQIAHLEKSITDKGVAVTTRIVTGFAAGNIVEQAKKVRANYIVLGSHGHTAFYDLLVGSTTTAVLKKAPCPVVIVPAPSKKTAGKSGKR